MTSVITLLVTLIGQLLPAIGLNSQAIQSIINTLITIIPLISKEISDVIPAIKNIIQALQNNPSTTASQLVSLQALDAQCDAAFEAAVASAAIEDGVSYDDAADDTVVKSSKK